MRLAITAALLYSFLLISCEAQLSETEQEVAYQSSNNSQRAVLDTNNTKKRDGVPVTQAPGAQIDEEKVDEMLEEGNLSFSSIANAEATEEDLKNNVEKLNQLLQNERVRNDNELQYIFHNMLGNVYFRLFKHSEQRNDLEKAEEHADTAISIFESQPEYKADLADAYMLRSSIYFEKKEYDKIISLMKYLIEEYQEIGYGPYENWFASHQVEGLNNLARMDALKTDNTRNIVDYLGEIAERYNNEVGITAQITLLERYVRKDNQNKVRTISESINNRLESLNNPAFKEHKLKLVKSYMDRIENKNNQ